MPPVIQENVMGSLVALGIPENACFDNFTELLKSLPTWLGVSVPASVSNVSISVTEPGTDQKQNLWIRVSGTGQFLGFYLYFNGGWKLLYNYAETEVIWLFGDSSLVGIEGTELEPFTLITTSGPSSIPEEARNAIRAQYAPIPGSDPLRFSYFAVVYSGY